MTQHMTTSPSAATAAFSTTMETVGNVVVDNFWAASQRPPLGHESAYVRFRELIIATQQPATCERRCRLDDAYHGGALADVRRLSFALLHAVRHECALVTDWPRFSRTANGTALVTTSAELRRRCGHANRRTGLRCYFLAPSTCEDASDHGRRDLTHEVSFTDARMDLDKSLDWIHARTGLRSEILIMGLANAWIMRPQPELREAIWRYGVAQGLDRPGARDRRIGIHIRHGDKHSLYGKHLSADAFRVSAKSFEMWGRRVGADIGAEHALYMTDDPQVMSSLEARGDGFFQLAPSGRECLPTHAAGVMGDHHVPATTALIKVHVGVAKRTSAVPAACGPSYLVDDGIQLFAGVYLLAQCAAFIGTQISNIDAAAVELMATLRHPPAVYDVLADMHRACLSDEQVWFGGTHTHHRPLNIERLALGGDNQTDANNCVPRNSTWRRRRRRRTGKPNNTNKTD